MEGVPNAKPLQLLLIVGTLLLPGSCITTTGTVAAESSSAPPSSSLSSFFPSSAPLVSSSSLSASLLAESQQYQQQQQQQQQQLDVLNALGLRENAHRGVTLTLGPPGGQPHPAYRLQGEERSLRAPPSVCRAAARLLRDCAGEFTVAAVLRQERDTSGTLIAFSDNADRYLELQSSGRRDEVRLHYTHISADNSRHVHIEVFKYELADGKWHKLAVSVSGSQVEMLVDCHSVYRRILKPGPPHRNFSSLDLELWVGQRNKHSFFKGSLHSVSLVSGAHGHTVQCPDANLSCPTCGEFAALRDTVESLARNVRELAQRLVKAENNVAQLEQCDCVKSCDDNGTIRADGASWKKDCDICTCVHGVIECKKVHCAALNCTHPEPPQPGECCKKCLRECYSDKVLYEHGEVTTTYYEVKSPKPESVCVRCICKDGVRKCDRSTCPRLQCPEHLAVHVPGKCCKVCRGTDYCSQGHNCHLNATCVNLQTRFACSCNRGYTGDGIHFPPLAGD